MVLTTILAPLCLVLVSIVFVQWQRINECKHDAETARRETDGLREQNALQDKEIGMQRAENTELRSEIEKAKTRRFQDECTFDAKLGLYRHISKPGFFCGACTPKGIESPVQETEQGWRCQIDHKHWHPNPDYKAPPQQRFSSRRSNWTLGF